MITKGSTFTVNLVVALTKTKIGPEILAGIVLSVTIIT